MKFHFVFLFERSKKKIILIIIAIIKTDKTSC